VVNLVVIADGGHATNRLIGHLRVAYENRAPDQRTPRVGGVGRNGWGGVGPTGHATPQARAHSG